MSDSARALRVTLVDLLGLFVPGALLVLAIAVFPPVLGRLSEQFLKWSNSPEVLKVLVGAGYPLVGIAAILLGFLNRVVAMRLAASLTGDRKLRKLEREIHRLDQLMDAVLPGSGRWEAITAATKIVDSSEVARYAPRFHFLKRHLRARHPDLWAEAERLEAEVRLIGGLLVPLSLLLLEAAWHAVFTELAIALPLALVLAVGLVVLWYWFPIRRAREVAYLYFLVLATLPSDAHGA